MAAYAKNNNQARLSKEEVARLWSDLKHQVKQQYPIITGLTDLTGVTLRQTGRTYEALCPFHVEKTPSFKVDPARGTYRCFGCGAHGDVLELVKDTQSLDFQPAVIFAADKAGIPVHDALRRMIQGRAAPKKKRNLVRYSGSEVRKAPGVLADPGFIKVTDQERRPRPNREFRLWNNGGQLGDRDREERRYFPQMVHEYRDVDGDLLMCVLRVQGRDKKFFIPARLMVPTSDCPQYLREKTERDGQKLAWVSIGPRQGDAKPIYGMEDVKAWVKNGGRNVLIVEGEKTRDAAKRLISAADPKGHWLVLSPMGGSKASIYADWKPFFETLGDRKVNIVQWPDADKPLQRPDGTVEDRIELAVNQGMTVVAQRALDHGVSNNLILGRVIPPDDVESGWDVADAEKEGWSPSEVLNYIKKNSRKVNMGKLELRKQDENQDPKATGREEPEMAAPFDCAGEPADQDDIDWLEALSDDDGAENGVPEDALTIEDVELDLTSAPDEDGLPEVEDVDASAIVPADHLEDGDVDDPEEEAARRNGHFRCLGYLDNANFFLSLRSGQVFEMAPSKMTSTHLLHLAPLFWWEERFPKLNARGQEIGVDWQMAVNALIEATYDAGVWDPRTICKQGARIDGGTVVFNSGNMLFVDGQGKMPLNEFNGKFTYTVGPKTRMPETEEPFTAESEELREFLDIIRRLDWQEERRELSIMALFGWIAISPICGILEWRPHIWLDGPRGSGKSWVVNNMINPVLGDFVVNVLANSSESGIRNLLSDRSMPVVFDEAEAEDKENKQRMDAIIKMARHSSVKSDAVVAQGVMGGGGHRGYSIASTFLMTSIVPQLAQAADGSRFARIKLASGRKHDGFKNEIELPALKLITKEFSDRWIGRMLLRAKDYHETYAHMVHGLCRLGLERRVADVFGSFATGCWLMLRDGAPEDEIEAADFIADQFDNIDQLEDFNQEITEDKDHNRLFAELQAHEVRLDGRNNAGTRSEQLGTLIEVACGYNNDDTTLSVQEAREVLQRYGIRPAIGDTLAGLDDQATTVLIHKKSTPIRDILDKTPYARSYPDVMHQGDGVKMGKTVRFGAGLPASRSIIVPLKHFSIGVEDE